MRTAVPLSFPQGTFERISRSLAPQQGPSFASPRASSHSRFLSPPDQRPAIAHSQRSYAASNWVTTPSVFAPGREFEPASSTDRRQRQPANMSHAEAATGPSPDAEEGQKNMLAAKRKVEAEREASKGAGWFPLGYRTAVRQWWANVPAATAEHELMSFIPYLKKAVPTQTQSGAVAGKPGQTEYDPASKAPSLERKASATAKTEDDPYGPREWKSELVQLSGRNRALNEFSIHRAAEQVDHNLVMLHGYGAGLGYFYLNFEGLSRLPGWRVFALDLLGMGRSSRPPFKINAKISKKEAVTEAEDFFVDALEEWRIKRKLERFTLMGHSLGGYLAVAYALKYPGHIEKLILASPVGIPEDPYAVQQELPDVPDSGETENGASVDAKKSTARQRPYPKWLTYLWDANVSPFSIVRWTGPLGPRFVSGWTSRRFGHLPPEQAQALHTYSYTLFKQRGSGEYALAYILAPGAFARSPLIHRIAGVGRQTIQNRQQQNSNQSQQSLLQAASKEHGFPVVLMYGDKDWMDSKGGARAVKLLDEAREEHLRNPATTDAERQLEHGSAKLKIVKDAGHHLYLEGWQEFNEFMRAEMEDTAAWTRAQQRS